MSLGNYINLILILPNIESVECNKVIFYNMSEQLTVLSKLKLCVKQLL